MKVTVWALVNRVSYYYGFETYVLSKNLDHLIIASAAVLWFALSIRTKVGYAVATSYGIIAITSALFGLDTVLEIAVLLSLPIIVLLMVVN